MSRETAMALTQSSPAQIALAWTLLNPGVTSTIVGARTIAQFEDNLSALDVTFSDDQIARLEAVSRIQKGFPHDMVDSDMATFMFGGVKVELPRER